MRHRKSNVKLGRTASHRKAMLRNMATSLIQHESIKTTVPKAKALRPIVDRLVTLAKRGDLPAIRSIAAVLMTKDMVKKLLTMKDRFSDRSCGYTLMAKAGFRAGDAAPMCFLSLIRPEDGKASTGLSAPASRATDRSRRVAASRAKIAKVAGDGAVEPSSTQLPGLNDLDGQELDDLLGPDDQGLDDLLGPDDSGSPAAPGDDGDPDPGQGGEDR
ncbi:MAG: 50S ribosomal protein L17 [Deltaproteobacteria bacterium]|nr:50S ribosomal protein L17 [Deltaproteobacteria bacterium]